VRFTFRQGDGEPFSGELTAFEPPALMEVRWADDLLRFELEAEGSGCILSLTVTFPEHGKAARDAAGWHVRLERLSYVSTGAPQPWSASERWQEVRPRYVARLGPETSVLGPPQAREQTDSQVRSAG